MKLQDTNLISSSKSSS